MSLLLALVMVGALLAVVMIVVVVSTVTVRAVPASARPVTTPTVNRDRDGRRALVVGLLIGSTGAVILTALPMAVWPGGLGLTPALAPAWFGLAVAVSVAAGELGKRLPSTPVRFASLVRRSAVAVAPGFSRALAGLGLGALVVVLATGTVMGSPDDLGRVGRTLTTACVDAAGAVTMSSSRGPWPGWFYAGPLAAAALGTLVVCGFGLRAVARRPSPSPDDEVDIGLRRRSAGQILDGIGVMSWSTVVPLSTIMSINLVSSGACPPSWHQPVGLLFLIVAIVGAPAAIACLFRLVASAVAPVSRDEPTPCPKSARYTV